MSHAPTAVSPPIWRGLIPAVFVLIWSTGFFIGKLGLAYAPPFTLLAMRFAITAMLMIAAAIVLRAVWPRRPPPGAASCGCGRAAADRLSRRQLRRDGRGLAGRHHGAGRGAAADPDRLRGRADPGGA